jgi:hypothetical protein
MRKLITLAMTLLLLSVIFTPLIQAEQKLPEMKPDLSEQIVKKFQDTGDSFPLSWVPGSIISIFLRELFYLIEDIRAGNWFPGMILLFPYVFLFEVLRLFFHNP